MQALVPAGLPPAPPPYRFLRLRPGCSVRALVRSEEAAVWTHWDGQTVPCLGEACALCAEGRSKKWLGAYVLQITSPPPLHVLTFSAAQGNRWKSPFLPGQIVTIRKNARSMDAEACGAGPVQPVCAYTALRWLWRRSLPGECAG
jgi:hypothetical protein